MKLAFVTVAHHSYYTTGVTEQTVGHGPAGADEAYLPVRASVARVPAGSCAIPMTVVVVAAKKMIITRQSTRALTVSSGMSRSTCGGNGAPVPQVVGSFPSGVECRTVKDTLHGQWCPMLRHAES